MPAVPDARRRRAWRASGLLGAALALVAGAAPARAATDLGAERIVVTGDGASATVERAPFRLSFQDGAGRTVLREVDNPRAAPFPVVPAPSPVPLGQDVARSPALYAPISFTVGAQAVAQAPATQYSGNLLTGAAAGVTYAARDVLAATREGDGVRLTLSTSDPAGRTLSVLVAPGARGTMRLSARPSDPAGVSTMADSFAAGVTEAFHGFGGRHNAIDQRGEDFLNWNQQENTSPGLLAPVSEGTDPRGKGDQLLFPNGRTAAYYVQSQFISSECYGFLLDRDELSRWRMAADRPDAWRTEVAAPQLDYLVAPGDAPLALDRLTAVTGRHRVPPDWAVGTMFDRSTRYPNDSPEAYAREVENDLRDFRRYGLPLDAYRIEGWRFLSDAQDRDVIARLGQRRIRSLVYFRAFVGTDANVGTDDPAEYQEAIDKGYVATRADGSPYVFLSNFQAPAALIDFTNAAAVRWWRGRLTRALDLGASGFMTDFGEQVQQDMHFADGSTGASMHNRYGKLYHAATRAAIDAYEAAHPERGRIWFFSRTGYSGTPGSAASEGSDFAGDGTTDFSRSAGLAAQAPDMLNRAVGGLFGFTTDIGGYFDLGPYQPTMKELFIRWAQWSALTPHFRLHGSVAAGTHTPWSYDAETVGIYNALSRLHQAAAPLILALWKQAAADGMPPTRPLWLAHPEDPVAVKQDQEWLLGPDVLVAPVVTQGATGRDVHFPAGCWQHPETGLRVVGPRSQRVAARLDELPYFFRCGTSPFRAAASGGAALPRRCASRRRFTIRVKRPRRGAGRPVSAVVYVNGRRVRSVTARKGRRLRTRIDLRGMPRRRVSVRVVVRTDRGRRYVDARRYRTCEP